MAGLKRAKANLKRYKAAILKAAVEGRLTEQWRKEHPDVEPAEKLLQRILAERRAKWEQAELAKMKAKGEKPTDKNWMKKIFEPQPPDPEGPAGNTYKLDLGSIGIPDKHKRRDYQIANANLRMLETLPYFGVANCSKRISGSD